MAQRRVLMSEARFIGELNGFDPVPMRGDIEGRFVLDKFCDHMVCKYCGKTYKPGSRIRMIRHHSTHRHQ